uniref:DNA replication licensing factor mcm5 n=1 Tax=Lygus hesperus TaxID=30085 RepID=A0A0A9Z486_LYGHE
MQNDAGLVHVTNMHGGSLLAGDGGDYNIGDPSHGDVLVGREDSSHDLRLLSMEFIEHFRVQHHFVYMEMLRHHIAAGLYFVEVQMTHVQQFSDVLFNAIQHNPTRALPIMESAI